LEYGWVLDCTSTFEIAVTSGIVPTPNLEEGIISAIPLEKIFDKISDLDVGVTELTTSDIDFIDAWDAVAADAPTLELGVVTAIPLENSLLADMPDGDEVEPEAPCDIPSPLYVPCDFDIDVSLIPAIASALPPTVSAPV
jgi:hypothetical protein